MRAACGHALGKIIRVLPEPVAGPTAAVRGVSTLDRFTPVTPGAETTAALVQACAARHRVRLGYLLGPDDQREMDVDPWVVAVRRGRWVEALPETFTPPADLDAHQTVEEHLSEGWPLQVEVVIEAPVAEVTTWVRRSLGRLEGIDAEHTRLVATTNAPDWYAGQLAVIRAPYLIVGPPELREASLKLGRRLIDAASPPG